MAEIEGLKELSRKLVAIGAVAGGKVLRASAFAATTPAFQAIKAGAPVGKKIHRTFKGRLVAPGFLKRSMRRRSKLRKGRAIVTIGVDSEAFYGVSFVDQGTKNQDATPWFERRFVSFRRNMVDRLADGMRKKIIKIAKRPR